MCRRASNKRTSPTVLASIVDILMSWMLSRNLCACNTQTVHVHTGWANNVSPVFYSYNVETPKMRENSDILIYSGTQ